MILTVAFPAAPAPIPANVIVEVLFDWFGSITPFGLDKIKVTVFAISGDEILVFGIVTVSVPDEARLPVHGYIVETPPLIE